MVNNGFSWSDHSRYHGFRGQTIIIITVSYAQIMITITVFHGETIVIIAVFRWGRL